MKKYACKIKKSLQTLEKKSQQVTFFCAIEWHMPLSHRERERERE